MPHGHSFPQPLQKPAQPTGCAGFLAGNPCGLSGCTRPKRSRMCGPKGPGCKRPCPRQSPGRMRRSRQRGLAGINAACLCARRQAPFSAGACVRAAGQGRLAQTLEWPHAGKPLKRHEIIRPPVWLARPPVKQALFFQNQFLERHKAANLIFFDLPVYGHPAAFRRKHDRIRAPSCGVRQALFIFFFHVKTAWLFIVAVGQPQFYSVRGPFLLSRFFTQPGKAGALHESEQHKTATPHGRGRGGLLCKAALCRYGFCVRRRKAEQIARTHSSVPSVPLFRQMS